MFEKLKGFKYILVTGPQRSGTTIVSHIIGHDTKKVVLDEVNYQHKNIRAIPGLLAQEKSCVLQCPQALPWMPTLTRKDMAIVMVYRDIKEINESVQKSKTPKGKSISLPWFSPEQAYDLWEKIKTLLCFPGEVLYDSIKDHPLYIPKSQRNKGWTHKSIDQNKRRYNRKEYN